METERPSDKKKKQGGGFNNALYADGKFRECGGPPARIIGWRCARAGLAIGPRPRSYTAAMVIMTTYTVLR
jgi:hypothetical protein